MKLRESGMPDEAYWETLFDVPLILERLGIDSSLENVAEFGCGYGTFTIPVAQRIRGTLYTFDLEAAMLERTRQRAAEAGLTNIIARELDVWQAGYGLPQGSVDACLLFNILHGEDPSHLLQLSAEIVRLGGFLLVIHWRYDPATPRGPSMDIRPRPEQILDWARAAGGLEVASGLIDLPPWHFGWRFRRTTVA